VRGEPRPGGGERGEGEGCRDGVGVVSMRQKTKNTKMS
jgi:hypothetical protein